MIDLACIFTAGGVILFYRAFISFKQEIINYLITNFLA